MEQFPCLWAANAGMVQSYVASYNPLIGMMQGLFINEREKQKIILNPQKYNMPNEKVKCHISHATCKYNVHWHYQLFNP